MSDGAACACRNPEYNPVRNEDGSFTERWACPDCGSEFVKKAVLMVMLEREALISEQLSKVQREHDSLDACVSRLQDRLDVLETNRTGLPPIGKLLSTPEPR